MNTGHPSAPCPKCGRRLSADGSLSLRGVLIPLYCCPECLVFTRAKGQTTEWPLTFIVGPDGRAMDPADPKQELDFTEDGGLD